VFIAACWSLTRNLPSGSTHFSLCNTEFSLCNTEFSLCNTEFSLCNMRHRMSVELKSSVACFSMLNIPTCFSEIC